MAGARSYSCRLNSTIGSGLPVDVHIAPIMRPPSSSIRWRGPKWTPSTLHSTNCLTRLGVGFDSNIANNKTAPESTSPIERDEYRCRENFRLRDISASSWGQMYRCLATDHVMSSTTFRGSHGCLIVAIVFAIGSAVHISLSCGCSPRQLRCTLR